MKTKIMWFVSGLVAGALLFYAVLPHYQIAVADGNIVRLNTLTGSCRVIQPANWPPPLTEWAK